MTAINKFSPTGYALRNGDHLNKIVALINNLTGNGTPGPVTANGLTTSGVRSLALTTVAAAGASQGTATAIAIAASLVLVTVTASTQGVKLPTAATGRQVQIIADTVKGNKVYAAAAGQTIGTATTATTAFALALNTSTTFVATSATKWRALKGA